MQTIQGIILIIGVVFAHSVLASSSRLTCNLPQAKVPTDWVTMVSPCTMKMREQVQEELKAAMTYMAMGAHFARDTINRPGFSKMFFESASEEREHAIKIIEYLLMRGELLSTISTLIKDPVGALFADIDEVNKLPEVKSGKQPPAALSWDDGVGALKAALNLETHVTNKIRDIIKVCEKPTEKDDAFNDYHLVDYLTGDFLEEQYKGQRDLAGKISTLDKMMASHGPLGEFLFDKKLLSGSPV